MGLAVAPRGEQYVTRPRGADVGGADPSRALLSWHTSWPPECAGRAARHPPAHSHPRSGHLLALHRSTLRACKRSIPPLQILDDVRLERQRRAASPAGHAGPSRLVPPFADRHGGARLPLLHRSGHLLWGLVRTPRPTAGSRSYPTPGPTLACWRWADRPKNVRVDGESPQALDRKRLGRRGHGPYPVRAQFVAERWSPRTDR